MMDLENSPSLPNAHQQIRLGDLQASAQKWSAAIEFYLRAIDYFKAIQKTLQDDKGLISTIQAQIIQCEKTVHICRLKDRAEQAIRTERHSTITRANSTSNIKPSTKTNRKMPRYNTMQLENSAVLGGRDGTDSFAAIIFPNKDSQSSTKNLSPMSAKKNKKDDSEKMEELQMSYEALKTHLKAAFDDIERLKNENTQLRMQKEGNNIQEQIDFQSLSTSREQKETDNDTEESENELEARL